MSGFTPGPWEWSDYPGMPQLQPTNAPPGEKFSPEEYPVCVTYVCESCKKDNRKCLSPNESDKRLIQMAPEMFGALVAANHYGKLDKKTKNRIDSILKFVTTGPRPYLLRRVHDYARWREED